MWDDWWERQSERELSGLAWRVSAKAGESSLLPSDFPRGGIEKAEPDAQRQDGRLDTSGM